MKKARISLDGVWDFQYLGSSATSLAGKRNILVPSPWQAQFPDLSMRGGVAVYRRSVEAPADWLGQRVFLHFGAVFHIAHVFVNGALIGSHVGGFLPFYFDVTDASGRAVRRSRCESKVRRTIRAEFPHTPFAEMPFGKQSWYGSALGDLAVCVSRTQCSRSSASGPASSPVSTMATFRRSCGSSARYARVPGRWWRFSSPPAQRRFGAR